MTKRNTKTKAKTTDPAKKRGAVEPSTAGGIHKEERARKSSVPAAVPIQPTEVLLPPPTFGLQDDLPPTRVQIDPDLKARAHALAGSWSGVYSEELDEQDLTEVLIKFRTTQHAQAALVKAREFLDVAFNEFDRRLHPLPKAVTREDFAMRREQFLPPLFQELVDDIDQTAALTYMVPGVITKAAQLYVRVFDDHEFIRAWVPSHPDEPASQERANCFTSLQRTQTQLLAFLRKLIEVASSHRVRITPDLSITVDGDPFQGKGAAKRALFALAKLRDKAQFTTEDFSKLFYYGKEPVEPAKDFQNAMRDLKKVLPRCEHESSKNLRTMRHLTWEVQATAEQLRGFLEQAAK